MINDKDKIKDTTGLSIGKVFFDGKEYSEIYDKELVLYDVSSGNFHLLPNDDMENLPEVKEAIQNIPSKRQVIITELEKKLEGSELKVNKRVGHRVVNKAIKATGMECAFYYIRVEGKNNYRYDLMFSRFYTDKDEVSDERTVNCVLCSYQFAYSQYDDYSYLVYPESGRERTDNSISFKKGYYNPYTQYELNSGDDIDKITQEFVDYIYKIQGTQND